MRYKPNPHKVMHSSDASALTLDELIFADRNQAYGAFDLRRHYKPTLTRALGLGVGLFLLGLLAPMLYNRLRPVAAATEFMQEIKLEDVSVPEEKVPLPIPPVEIPNAYPTVKNVMPVVVMDAPEEMPVATVEELAEATSGQETTEGTGDIEVIAPPEAAEPTVEERAVEVAPKTEDIFIRVEQEPQYPGGLDALRNFLSKNLQYPKSAASAGVSGKVYISFVINTDGSLTDVQVLKGIGFGCDEEATRVIQKMPHWKPGKQSGRPVRVKYNLPIALE
ncbi:TonB family protein [Spirosoma soli]|uniref:TonB family protein n=1 Tax=Spirosoma soli TaxID=1770529 RepID=A0ABW5M1X2_9BACT